MQVVNRTNSMEQIPSCEANNGSAGQDFFHLLLDRNVHCHAHKSPPFPKPCLTFRNMLVVSWLGIASFHPTHKMEDHLLLAVCDCLFNIVFTAIESLQRMLNLEVW